VLLLLLLLLVPLPPRSQELWALLHFIMPQLFDSREAFTEWFTRVSRGLMCWAATSAAQHSMAQCIKHLEACRINVFLLSTTHVMAGLVSHVTADSG
jgi:hypothetical protein